MEYSLTNLGGFDNGGNISVNVPTAPPEEKPLIPAWIGPDPRNANCNIGLPKQFSQEGPNGIRFDFLFGCRIYLPEGEDYRLILADQDTGTVLFDQTVPGNNSVADERKFFIRYHIQVRKASDNSLIWEHRYDCRGKKVYVVVPDGALGDNMAWMPYAEEFRKVHQADVTCVIGEWMIRLTEGQYPKLKMQAMKDRTAHVEDGYACYFCAIFPKERKNWRPIDHQHLGMQRAIAAILGLPREEHRIRLKLGGPRVIKEPYVCISSMATNPCKHWNFPDGWNTIVRWLRGLGYRVLAIDREDHLSFENGRRYDIPSEAENFTGPLPLSERLAMLEHADFFIGLPSGLSWLAWGSGTPVVLLSGFTMDNCEFSTPYRITNHLFCHGCWNDTDAFFDTHSPVWCPRHAGTPREIECTRAITPHMVRETIRRIPAFQKHLKATGIVDAPEEPVLLP